MRRLRRLQKLAPRSGLWLTETGGLVRRDNASTTDIPEGARHAADVTRYIFDGGRERPSLFVLVRVLRFGLLPSSSFPSPGG
jgi:hypothetical protein